MVERPRSISPLKFSRNTLPRLAKAAHGLKVQKNEDKIETGPRMARSTASSEALISDTPSFLQKAAHQKHGRSVLPSMQLSIQHSLSSPSLETITNQNSPEGISLSLFDRWGSIEQTPVSRSSTPGSPRSLREIHLYPLSYEHVSTF
jgi:hypothetical protein